MRIGIEAGRRGGLLIPLWNDDEHLDARLTTTAASGGDELLQRVVCVREDDDDVAFVENPLMNLSAQSTFLLRSHLSVTYENELGWLLGFCGLHMGDK